LSGNQLGRRGGDSRSREDNQTAEHQGDTGGDSDNDRNERTACSYTPDAAGEAASSGYCDTLLSKTASRQH
jgi:hypothetical protein